VGGWMGLLEPDFFFILFMFILDRRSKAEEILFDKYEIADQIRVKT
jgi:hypothetical protein